MLLLQFEAAEKLLFISGTLNDYMKAILIKPTIDLIR